MSVGTLHEALRLLQSTGEIVVRTGPGGGIFAGQSSALSDLVRSVNMLAATDQMYPQVARVFAALSPLLFEDAIAAMDDAGAALLNDRLGVLREARHGELRDVFRASLEMFSTIATIPEPGILAAIAGAILRLQLDTLRRISGPVDPDWRGEVDAHVDAVAGLVAAIVERDLAAALAARRRPGFMRLFEALAESSRA